MEMGCSKSYILFSRICFKKSGKCDRIEVIEFYKKMNWRNRIWGFTI